MKILGIRTSEMNTRDASVILAYSSLCFIAGIILWLATLHFISRGHPHKFDAVILFSSSQPYPKLSTKSFAKVSEIKEFSFVDSNGNSSSAFGNYERFLLLKKKYTNATVVKLDSIPSLLLAGLLWGFVVALGTETIFRKYVLRQSLSE